MDPWFLPGRKGRAAPWKLQLRAAGEGVSQGLCSAIEAATYASWVSPRSSRGSQGLCSALEAAATSESVGLKGRSVP